MNTLPTQCLETGSQNNLQRQAWDWLRQGGEGDEAETVNIISWFPCISNKQVEVSITRPLTESESKWCRSRQTIALTGWVSGLFSAKTKLPLSGGESLGEPIEGFHLPVHHPHGQRRTEKEGNIAQPGRRAAEDDSWEWSTHLMSVTPLEQGGDVRQRWGKKEISPARHAHAFRKKYKSTNNRAKSGFFVVNNYATIRAGEKRSGRGIIGD